MLKLSTPISDLHMVGLSYIVRLKKLNIYKLEDLLYHVPFRYENYSVISKINLLQQGETVTVSAQVGDFKNIFTRSGKKIQKAVIFDDTGSIDVIWYNQPFLKNIIKEGVQLIISGEVKMNFNKLSFQSPEYELVSPGKKSLHTGRLVPVYPETKGVSSKWLRSRIATVLSKLNPQIVEFLPDFTRKKYLLIDQRRAVNMIHFPPTMPAAHESRKRLAFDELIILQLQGIIKRRKWHKKSVVNIMEINSRKEEVGKFIKNLPFRLTDAQYRVWSEIAADLSQKTPMNRLLQGDVGSGKTIIATIALYLSYLNGYQSALMAPTEILANQHYQSINSLLSPLGVKTALITGSTRKITKSKKADIFIGTHSLLSESIAIPKLALIVIDEQQRFGVKQRTTLRLKGNNPHVLTMTATPIPRTVALTLYADLDLSVLDEMPKGRLRVKTWVAPPQKRKAAYEWIKKQIKQNASKTSTNQAFIICPLIEASETLASVKSATQEYEKLQKNIYPDMKLGLIHGRMKSQEKNKIISDFKKGYYQILVATPVVEVGIDITNATIIMIEAAERFGLAQLHQLRGRVGRGKNQSYCLLFTESENATTLKRLKFLETTNIGIKLAELDLKLRGPGQLFGTKQHGDLGLKIADLSDINLIQQSKKAAQELIDADGSLKKFPYLREKMLKYKIDTIAED